MPYWKETRAATDCNSARVVDKDVIETHRSMGSTFSVALLTTNTQPNFSQERKQRGWEQNIFIADLRVRNAFAPNLNFILIWRKVDDYRIQKLVNEKTWVTKNGNGDGPVGGRFTKVNGL